MTSKPSSSIEAFRCITCGGSIAISTVGDITCGKCGERYFAANGYLKTNFDEKLFNAFRKQYLLNKVLNNNGFIGYQLLKEGSLSLPDRPEVKRFRDFVETHLRGTRILDIGCGIMDLPGYLAVKNVAYLELIGLDPIDDNTFGGMRLVAVSEYIPLQDATIDTIVFATSFDHVCDIDRTLAETRRILSSEGRVLVWMSDRGSTPIERLKDWLRRRRNSWREGYNLDDYYVYKDSWTVMRVPPGGVDPYHSHFESPSTVVKQFTRAGFSLIDEQQHSKQEVFLAFRHAH